MVDEMQDSTTSESQAGNAQADAPEGGEPPIRPAAGGPAPAPNRAAAILVLLGALGAVVLVLVVLFGLAFHAVSGGMKQVLQDAPLDFAAPEYTSDEVTTLKQRVADASAARSDLSLDARSLSILLTEYLRSGGGLEAKAAVEIRPPARVSVKASQPVDGETRRWLNIQVSASLVSSRNGLAVVYDSIIAGGRDITKWFNLEMEGKPGKPNIGPLVEVLIPETAVAASVSPDEKLVFRFAPPDPKNK